MVTRSPERFDVAVIGGGPAGSLVAAHLAGAGRSVVLFERSPAYRWRAGGVFASPAATARLLRAGLPEATLASVARPIAAMRVEAPGGATIRLTYGTERGGPPAVGFDRAALDPALLDRARTAGARMATGSLVTGVDLGRRPTVTVRDHAGERTVEAAVVVGADGRSSAVARAAGVDRRTWLGERVGLSYHVPESVAGSTDEARMVVLRGAYCGIAPVPGGRLNVGIVLASAAWRTALRSGGAHAVASSVVRALPRDPRADEAWREASPLDAVAGAVPLGVRVARRGGPGWLLVGDAAGFLDPFTGEGIHRAIVSAELASAAVTRFLDGDRVALDRYDRRMRSRFRGKDLVSLIVQGFLARPALFDYAARRLAARARERETLGLVIGDLAPASRALSPRFLARVLGP
jgi:flavin-dependent dehydrogenase